MKAKLKVIKNWEFEEFELTGTSFKYSPTGCKGMVARSEDEIVFWTYHLAQKCSGVLWVKGEVSRWIPSPEPKEQQDVWEDPVLLSCDRGILLVCPASKSLWWMPQMDGEWIPIPMDNWCAQGIPKPVAVTGSQGVFPIVCRVDNSADATNSFTSLTVDFETMTAHWAESGSCVYSKAGTRQTHLAAVERAGGNFAQADFHYNYPMIGSILEQDGQFYAFLESSTINPAGLSLMGYYWYLELEENGLFKKKLWGKDNLSRLPGKHGMRGKFSGDRTCLILSPIFKNDDWKGMAKVMEKRFVNWQGQSFDEATLEPSDLAEAMMEYLDCECTYFPSMTDDDPIMSAYNYAKRESVKEGFVPVLIKADDETLWECLIMNSDPESEGEDDYAFDPDKVAEYRKKMLSAPVKNSKAVLEEMIGQRKEEAEDDDMDWNEEILGEMEGGYDNRRFSSYWNSDNNMTYPLILAKIPVKNPWEIFAYLPFGGWNECPNTPELMAVAKYWFEQHGAVPAAMSHDELEFLLPAPVPEEKAMDAAVELYGFCPDVIDQGPEDATVGALADVLRQSTVWYFWWD